VRELQGKVVNVVTTRQKDIPDESFTTKTEIIINLNTTKIATPDNFVSGFIVKTLSHRTS